MLAHKQFTDNVVPPFFNLWKKQQKNPPKTWNKNITCLSKAQKKKKKKKALSAQLCRLVVKVSRELGSTFGNH